MQPVFALGSSGHLIARLQDGLKQINVPKPDGGNETALKQTTGKFDPATQLAVQRVQSYWLKPATGVVGQDLWLQITGEAWPDDFERVLQLVAAYEDHGWTKAAGNYDGAGVTWGIIGFTLVQGARYGPLQPLLKDIIANCTDAFDNAFPPFYADLLRDVIDKPPTELKAEAVKMSDSSKGNAVLVEPWQTCFAKLGQDIGVQLLQRQHARLYYRDAIIMAKPFQDQLGMRSERTVQMMFDIAVQSGPKADAMAAARAAIATLIAGNPEAPFNDRLQEITEAVVAATRNYPEDARKRREIISKGIGKVHGRTFHLDAWGIEMDAANGPARPSLKSLLVLGFDPRQKGEQLALSSNVGRLVRPEPGIAIDKELVAASGISVIQSNGSSTVSLGSLLDSASVPKVNPNGEALLQAVNEMAGENVGILAIMGQYTSPPKGSATDYFVLGRKEKRYVGLVLRNASSLQFVRGGDDGDAPNEKVLDVTQLSRSLAKCKLIMLYGAFGIPAAGLPGTGPQWAKWLKGAANTPIVLGWFGSVRMPQDGYNEFVGGEFLKAVQKLLPGQDIETICLAQEENVIQAWGKACFKAFASEKKTAKGDAVRRMQKYLWYDKPLAFTDFFTTGAGAIGTDGRVWHADPDYDPTVQNAKAMKVVQP